MASQWGQVVNRLLQYLTRRLRRRGLPVAIIGCTEVQERRARIHGECYLHLHLAFVGRASRRQEWGVSASELREWWTAELQRRCAEPIGTLARIEMKPVRKSTEGYLGKYASKGSGAIAAIEDDMGIGAVPGQWWFCTSEMRAAIKSNTASGRAAGDFLSYFADSLMAGVPPIGLEYIDVVRLKYEHCRKIIAWFGRLARGSVDEVIEMCKRTHDHLRSA